MILDYGMLFIATPCTDQIPLHHHLSMIDLAGFLTAKSIPYQYATKVDCNSMRSRAELTIGFMNSDAEHVLFVDSDMIFKPTDVLRLLSLNLPIVGATYPKRQIVWDSVKTAIEKGDSRYKCFGNYPFQTYQDEDLVIADGVLKVKYAPSGFILIQREVISKMIAAYPETAFNNIQYGKAYALYDNIIAEDGLYLSADYSFCERANRIGITSYVDMTLKINHVGTHVFESDPTTCIT